MAPEVAKTIAELIAESKVAMIAGYTRGIRAGGEVTIEADRVINIR